MFQRQMLGGVLLFLVGGARAHVSLLWPPGDSTPACVNSVDPPCKPFSLLLQLSSRIFLIISISPKHLSLFSKFPSENNSCPPTARAPGLDFLDSVRTNGDCGIEPGEERCPTKNLWHLSNWFLVILCFLTSHPFYFQDKVKSRLLIKHNLAPGLPT